MSKSMESVSKGFSTTAKKPSLFIPALMPLVIHLLFIILGYVVFSYKVWAFDPWTLTWYVAWTYPNWWISWGGIFLADILGAITCCMIADMANDAINGQPVNFGKSMGAVFGKIGTLILAALISAVFLYILVLAPFALLVIAIAVIEGTNPFESIKKAFELVFSNFAEAIVFIIIVIVNWIIFCAGFLYLTVVGACIGAVIIWILNVFFTVASVHLYLSLRQALPPPPPPPPPPPL